MARILGRPDCEVYGDYQIRPSSNRTYRVGMRGPGLFDNYCSCPDFAVNTIGKCKHVEALLLRKPPAHNTLYQEIVTLHQTLKTALRHGWLDRLPDLSESHRSSPKISHRAWFSPKEYKQLYEATRKRAHEPSTARCPRAPYPPCQAKYSHRRDRKSTNA